MPTVTSAITINVLIEREGDWWVSQCLQINVGTQARTLREVYDETLKMIADHFEVCAEHGVDPFRRKAPPEYWEKYRATEMTTSPTPQANPERFLPGLAAVGVGVETRIAA